jgi:hypothetical protein
MAQREQLNLRLPGEWFEILGIAAMFDDVTVAEYVKEMLGQRVANLRLDPDIAVVRRKKADRAAAKDGNVTRLGERRGEKDG